METDPRLQVIIATVALTFGIHTKGPLDSISSRFPNTASNFTQAAGRVGARETDLISRAIGFVTQREVTAAKNQVAGEFIHLIR